MVANKPVGYAQQVVDLKRELTAKGDEIAKLNAQIQALPELQQEIAHLNAELTKAKQGNNGTSTQLKTQLTDAKQTVDQLTAQLRDRDASNRVLINQVSELQESLNAAAHTPIETTRLQNQLELSDQHVAYLTGQVQQVTRNAQSRIGEATNQVDSLSGELRVARMRLTALEKAMHEVTAIIIEAPDTMARLKELVRVGR